MRALAVALLLLLLAGCSSPAKPTVASMPVPEAAADLWDGQDQMEVAAFSFDGFEFDLPACQNGGAQTTAPEFQRSGDVADGTDHLEVTVTTDPSWHGVQVGYRFGGDEGEYTWLPTVVGGPETFTIPVAPSQWEQPAGDEDTPTWAFNHRTNLPEPASQDCWTGGGAGAFEVEVVAVKGTGSASS